jgi:hypothetical protein
MEGSPHPLSGLKESSEKLLHTLRDFWTFSEISKIPFDKSSQITHDILTVLIGPLNLSRQKR